MVPFTMNVGKPIINQPFEGMVYAMCHRKNGDLGWFLLVLPIFFTWVFPLKWGE